MLTEPQACPYVPRCPNRIQVCTEQLPVLEDRGDGHRAACFNPAPADEWRSTRLGDEAA
jgi:peptide/nickel transport system ATP-binding protein